MARPLAKSAPLPSAWSDIPSLLMLGTGTLLYLALISYVPSDLPAWMPISQSASHDGPSQNFIGPVGAVVAGLHFFFFGAASFLIPALLLGFGGAKLFMPSLRLQSRLLWMVAFVLCGACLAQLQPWYMHGWGAEWKAHAPGGLIGSVLEDHVFRRILGAAGSGILLAAGYVCTLILMTGLHPITQLLRACEAMRRWINALRERHHANRLARASAQDLLDMDAQRLAREQRRLEKQLRRKGIEPLPGEYDDDTREASEQGFASLAAVGAGAPVEDEFANLPAPKITDNSVPSPATTPPRKKPSLAELFSRNKDAASARAGGTGGNGRSGGLLDPTADQRFANYQLPDVDLLDTADLAGRAVADPAELMRVQDQLIDTLEQFGIKVSKGDITKGPTITRYEVYPAKGVRVDKIVSLERDLARATRAERINILAPIPGKDTVGIEIANSKKVKVTLRELLEGQEWAETTAKIPIALGKDVYGKTIIADLAAMPHCLVAGATGSGKSVCINSIISSILYRFTPEQLRFVMIDPKVVEMQIYNDLPHLVVPVVTDPKKVLLALRWVIDEMEKRYLMFAKTGVRNITGFNARPKPKTQAELDAEEAKNNPPPYVTDISRDLDLDGDEDERDAARAGVEDNGADSGDEVGAATLESILNGPAPRRPVAPPPAARPAARNQRDDDLIIPDQVPYIVVIVDELADLMQTAPADVESAIARITQKARAAGIHIILATQTPRADVITGVIKANVPARIAFQVASGLDSRIILDEKGAERLIGQGDMLYLPPGTSRLTRAQGVLVTDDEIKRVVEFSGKQAEPTFEPAIHERLQGSAEPEEDVSDEDEELVQKCIEIMRQEKKASTSMLQRRLRLGYTRAARVVDILEARGVVGPENGARGREILVDLDDPDQSL